jgi:uncharacterized protein YndB with AHSA1/START domain
MTRRTLTIAQQILLPAPPSQVFEALTSRRGLVRWFLADADISPTSGSEYTFRWQGGYHHTARVLAATPGRRLVLAWPNRAGRSRLMTVVAFSLHRKGRGTLLKLRHEGYPAAAPWIEVYGATQSGWAYYLTNLKSVLATGRDLRSRDDAV